MNAKEMYKEIETIQQKSKIPDNICYSWRKDGFLLYDTPDGFDWSKFEELSQFMQEVVRSLPIYLSSNYFLHNCRICLTLDADTLLRHFFGIGYYEFRRVIDNTIQEKPEFDYVTLSLQKIFDDINITLERFRDGMTLEIMHKAVDFGFKIDSHPEFEHTLVFNVWGEKKED